MALSNTMLQIVLIRPGATEYDHEGRVQGTLDLPLSEDGLRDVTRITEELRDQQIVTLYTSTCQSAAQTAKTIGESLQIKVKSLDKLRNLDHGLWQGMLIEDVRAKQPKIFRRWQDEPETVCPPQGETIAIARTRVAEVVSKLAKRHKSGVVGLVVPEPLASVVCNVLRQDELVDLWDGENVAPWERIAVAPNLEA